MTAHPRVAAFLATLNVDIPAGMSLEQWLAGVGDEALADLGMDREHILSHVARLMDEELRPPPEAVRSLTIRGGRDKRGLPEAVELTIQAGEIVCIVGPTGSGKSRLLADIECLAQGDTPTGRTVLVNGRMPEAGRRFALDRKLVAQLSQNMNFVVDLSVAEFVAMHAQCRGVADVAGVTARVIACANDLTGEKFAAEVSVTQLSGGQTRALMIADAALLSASPVVLIDEIENAGVDRKRALDLLVAEDKIVLISTHDPLLALRGGRRLVIRGGGIAEVIATSAAERDALARLERMDATMMDIRDHLRRGGTIEGELDPMDMTSSLSLLLNRRSCHALQAPAPTGEALDLIFRAAMRVPDFQRLRPFRFLVAVGGGLDRLGEAMRRAALAAGKSSEMVERAPRMPRRAPMVITVVASPKPSDIVPPFDQHLAAGCTVMAMQMAAVGLGFGGVWRSGWFMHDDGFHRELGLEEGERIVGFLYLGTPAKRPEPPPPEDPTPFIHWL